MFFRKTIFLLIAFLLWLPAHLTAEVISESEARQLASDFLLQRGKSPQRLPVRLSVQARRGTSATDAERSTSSDEDPGYYVFNVGQDEGFVVVSGDDRAQGILGYSDSGSLDVEQMPAALCELLQAYCQQIASLDTHVQQRPARITPSRKAIEPLIRTQWNQTAPYNNLCPTTNDNATATGCVATSMAQIMYYYKHPAAPSATIPGYTTRTLNIVMPELSVISFDWNNMMLSYDGTTTDAAQKAVATLMQYCGTALQMNYNVPTSGGSSAYNVSVAESLKRYFGYDNSAQLVMRSWYDYEDWVELLYDELAANRPFVMGGQSTGGGHSFVCDGYESDDYFHFNWGWGGSGDGFYRLSALNPYEQGVGGSSTLDGFSFSQEAIIGLRPKQDSSSPIFRLSLEGFQFGASDSEKTKTYNRASSSDPFNGISLYASLWNYQFETLSYDYALQLTDIDGNVEQTIKLGTLADMIFNKEQTVSRSDLSLGADLPDDTYYLKMVCRVSGGSSYSDCYGSTPLRMTAVVANNTLTLTAPFVKNVYPTLNSLAVSDDSNKLLGYEQDVIVKLTGGAADYRQNIFLYVNGVRVMGRQADIPAGQTVTMRFAYTPTEVGTNRLSIYTESSQLGSDVPVEISSSDATNKLVLDVSAVINNLQGEKLYGNALRATVTATNSSTDYRYVGTLNCSIRKWTSTDDGNGTTVWTWESVGLTHYPLEVAKNGGSTQINIAVDGLEKNAKYSVRITYSNSDESTGVKDGVHLGLDANNIGSLQTTSGYLLGNSDGTTTPCPASKAIDGGSAAFIDLRPMDDLSGVGITRSSNPNCLYLLEETQELDGIAENVVRGTTATSITLTDGYDFYSPISFTANNISYTRTFTRPAAGTSGWNTLFLPFAPSSVTLEGGKSVDWFHSSADSGKNFWLKTFTGDAPATVYFDHAETMEANTPYIIAVPGETWGDEWQMTGKTVTFAATNAVVGPTDNAALSGNNYNFYGSSVGQDLSNAYVLNDQGSTFQKKDAFHIGPFRAWLQASSVGLLTTGTLTIAAGMPTDFILIPTASPERAEDTDYYDLKGRRVSNPRLPGVYILHGKKYLLK